MESINTKAPFSVFKLSLAALLLAGFSAPALASPFNKAIAAAERQFGGEAFEAELYREDGRTYVEVEVLSGNQIVEALFLARGAQLIEAVRIARGALGATRILEAELRITGNAQRNGKRFVVDVRNGDGEFDVVINSQNGRVLRVIED